MTVSPTILDEQRKDRRRFVALKGWARRQRRWEDYLTMQGHQDCFQAFLSILHELDDEPRR
jgi:hypothetical protein